MSLVRLRSESVAASAIAYASVTEQVALGVARLEGSGAPEKAYTLATEAFREELGKVGVSGRVAILREERLDERGQMRPLKTRPGILSVGDVLGAGRTEVDLAVEPVEGLHLLTRGQQGAISAVAASPRGSMLRTPDMYMSKLIVGPRARGRIDIDAPVDENAPGRTPWLCQPSPVWYDSWTPSTPSSPTPGHRASNFSNTNEKRLRENFIFHNERGRRA